MKSKFLKQYKSQIFIIGVIVFISLTPFLWFRPGFFIEGVDVDFQPFPTQRLLTRAFTWNTNFIGGTDRSMETTALFFTGLQAFLKLIGLNDMILREKVLFVLWFMINGFSMYYFMSAVIKKKDVKSEIVKLLGVIFYLFNFYQLHIWMIVRLGEGSGAIILPVMFGFLIKGFKGEITFKKDVFLLTIFLIIGSGVGVQPPVLGVVILSTFLYMVFYILLWLFKRKEVNIRNIIKTCILLIIVFVLVNLFWILPVANFILQSNYNKSIEEVSSIFSLYDLLGQTSRHNSFLNVFRMFGDNVWWDKYIPAFFEYQKNVLLIILSFLFPILAFSCIFLTKSYKVRFFSFILLLSLFLSKGLYPPGENIFRWLFEHFPAFWIYRAPWQKFTLFTILAYSYLASITCGVIYGILREKIKLKENIRKIISGIFVIVIVISTLYFNKIFIFGGMFPTTEERNGLPGFHQKYPQYIFDAASFLDSQKEKFNTFILPYERSNAYTWGYGGAGDITIDLFFKQGLIFRQYGEGMMPPTSIENITKKIADGLEKESTTKIYRLMNLLNIDYALLRNDFLYDFYKNTTAKRIKQELAAQEEIYKEKVFGKWDLYKIKGDLDHIYATPNIIYVKGDTNKLSSLIEKDNYPKLPAVYFSELEKNSTEIIEKKANFVFENNELKETNKTSLIPEISFIQINPTKYVINVKNAQEPYLLNFLVPFHPQWKVYLIDKNKYKFYPSDTWFKNSISESNHFLVNGFANSWYIDKEGDYAIVLEYWPQRLFWLGLIISVITIIIIIFISIKRTAKNKDA